MNSAFVSDHSAEESRQGSGRDPLALLASFGLALGVAGLGSLSAMGASEGWYAHAQTTLWTPPSIVFGPVWIVLYTAMAIAAWLLWRSPRGAERSRALALYAGGLALNAGWSPLFFLGFDLVGPIALWVSLVWIVVLGFVVLATLLTAWRVNRPAAVLLVPYWGWLLFATALNASLAVMNG